MQLCSRSLSKAILTTTTQCMASSSACTSQRVASAICSCPGVMTSTCTRCWNSTDAPFQNVASTWSGFIPSILGTTNALTSTWSALRMQRPWNGWRSSTSLICTQRVMPFQMLTPWNPTIPLSWRSTTLTASWSGRVSQVSFCSGWSGLVMSPPGLPFVHHWFELPRMFLEPMFQGCTWPYLSKGMKCLCSIQALRCSKVPIEIHRNPVTMSSHLKSAGQLVAGIRKVIHVQCFVKCP